MFIAKILFFAFFISNCYCDQNKDNPKSLNEEFSKALDYMIENGFMPELPKKEMVDSSKLKVVLAKEGKQYEYFLIVAKHQLSLIFEHKASLFVSYLR